MDEPQGRRGVEGREREASGRRQLTHGVWTGRDRREQWRRLQSPRVSEHRSAIFFHAADADRSSAWMVAREADAPSIAVAPSPAAAQSAEHTDLAVRFAVVALSLHGPPHVLSTLVRHFESSRAMQPNVSPFKSSDLSSLSVEQAPACHIRPQNSQNAA